MSDAPRKRGIIEKARKGKKKVRGRRVVAEAVVGSARPMVSERYAKQLDESGSPQVVTLMANSSIGVYWPVFPPSPEQHKVSSAESGTSGSTRRPFLQREGINGFKPNLLTTSMITKIIRNRLATFYPTWSTIPERIRRDWFNEWRIRVDWDPVDEDHMWGAFNFKGGNCFYDMIADIRKAKKRPHWMGEDRELLRHSESPTFLQVSKINKENMKSPINCSLYASRSVPAGTHRDQMGKELGWDPTIIEHYRRTKFSTKKNKWLEPRPKAIQDVVPEKLQELASSQDSTTSTTPQLPLDKKFEIWKEAARRRKKRGIYGLGFFLESGISQSPQENISSSRAKIEEERTRVNPMSNDIASRMNQRLDRIESKLDQCIERFSKMVQYPPAPQQHRQNVNVGGRRQRRRA